MTKQDLLNLYVGLNTIGNLGGVKFSYGVARNISRLKPEIEAIDASMAFSKEYQEYDDARLVIVKKYAKKDENGEPTLQGKNFLIDDQVAFDEEINVLQESHKEAIAAREKQIDDYNSLLKTDVVVDLHKVKLEDVPEAITTAQMYALLPIIEE